MTEADGLELSLEMLRVFSEDFGASVQQSWARGQWSFVALLFKTLSLSCILRCWHIKIKLLDQTQNLHIYANTKCSFLAEKKNVQFLPQDLSQPGIGPNELCKWDNHSPFFSLPPPPALLPQSDLVLDSTGCFLACGYSRLSRDFLGASLR